VPTLFHGDVDPLVPLACSIDTARNRCPALNCAVAGMGHSLPLSMWPQIIGAIAAPAV
jgi:hypothetical protein